MRLACRGARAASHVYPMREFEADALGDSRGCELLCSPKTRSGFKTRVEVQAEADLTPGSLKITVLIPTGLARLVGGRFRFQPTPFGLDVEALQSGRRVARLRVAARCDSQGGLSSRCRFKRVSTRL